MRKRKPLAKGDTVRLRKDVERFSIPKGRGDNKTAKVVGVNLFGVGGVQVDRDLEGIKFWNDDDIAIVRRAP